MIRGNTITATLISRRNTVTEALYQYDYGQVLLIVGLELPSVFEVHFANEGSTQTKTAIGRDGQVEIPDEYLLSGKPINAFLYLHAGSVDGETEYKIKIPVRARPQPGDTPPTPVQQDAIDQAIQALNSAVDEANAAVSRYPRIIDGFWYIWDAENGRYVNTDTPAVGGNFWFGTREEYNSLAVIDPAVIYCIEEGS